MRYDYTLVIKYATRNHALYFLIGVVGQYVPIYFPLLLGNAEKLQLVFAEDINFVVVPVQLGEVLSDSKFQIGECLHEQPIPIQVPNFHAVISVEKTQLIVPTDFDSEYLLRFHFEGILGPLCLAGFDGMQLIIGDVDDSTHRVIEYWQFLAGVLAHGFLVADRIVLVGLQG